MISWGGGYVALVIPGRFEYQVGAIVSGVSVPEKFKEQCFDHFACGWLHHIRTVIGPFLLPFWGSFLRHIRTLIGRFLLQFLSILGTVLAPFWVRFG